VAAPTPNTSIYADGDLVGGKMTLNMPQSGIIESIFLLDQAVQDAALDLVFFSKNPSNTTFTNNSALDLHDTDTLTILGVVRIAASDYVDFADNSLATIRGVGLAYVADGPVLYACLLSNGATPTYANAADLQLTICTIPDA
jgi:hypothetical protein